MKQTLKNWHSRQSKEEWTLRIAMIIAILIGCLAAKFFGEPNRHFNYYFLVKHSWFVFGTASFITLFLLGYLNAKLRR